MSNATATLRVVSKRREKGAIQATADELIVDGDRPHVLSNRHYLHNYNDPDERAQVIGAFVVDLKADIAKSGPMSKAIDEIVGHLRAGRKVALRCWCAPRPCHLDHVRAEALSRFACAVAEDGPTLRSDLTDVEI